MDCNIYCNYPFSVVQSVSQGSKENLFKKLYISVEKHISSFTFSYLERICTAEKNKGTRHFHSITQIQLHFSHISLSRE